MARTKAWKNVEVSRQEAEKLDVFLYDNEIEYEESECYDKVHFEVCVDDYEEDAVNCFLDELEYNSNY